MKHLSIILFSLLTFYSCQQKTEERKELGKTENKNDFQINIDTLRLSFDGYLIKVVLFHDNFYGMFSYGSLNNSRTSMKMIVFSQKGKLIEEICFPKGIQNISDYNLVVQEGSLFAKENQFEKVNLVLDEYIAEFKPTEKKELKFYQDELYDIYAICNGEWGGTIFFKDKKTNENYEAASTCPIVINKINNEYYVTNILDHLAFSASVLKISDPAELESSNLNFESREGSLYNKGVELLLDIFDVDIATSFVVDDQLFHLYTDENGTYVGKIEKGEMRPISKFNFTFYAHFSQYLDNGKQLLMCYFKNNDDDKNGILIIDGKKFNFYKLK